MRRIISLVLCIVMLISSSNVVLADESTEEIYSTVSVEFSDNIGNVETLQVMVKNDDVYANAEELGERLGYDVSISEEYVSIYNQDADKNVPYGLTVFYYDSTKVGHMLFTQMIYSYEAPFEIIKNENGVWIPLEYSLLLLNSSMLVIGNTILIDMPSKNIIDIYMDVLKNNQTYLFEWQDDIGLSEENEVTMGKASFVATMFSGLVDLDGDSWVQFVQNIALDSSAYDSKYGEELAMLFCTYSDDELEQEVKEMKKLMSHFNGKGVLGKSINAIDKGLDKNIEDLLKTSNELKSQIDVNNNTSIVAYNKSYQALENACDKADFFSDATELYAQVGKGVSEATSFLDKFYKVAEVVGFASEFQNQDKFAVKALSEFVKNSDSQSVMSNAMKEGIGNYTGTLQTDIATYSALRYLKENYDDLIFEATDLVSSLGLPAQLMLIAWDVMSANVPFYKEGLSNTDSFMISMYASIFQADAFTTYQTHRNSIFNNVDNITPENLYEVSQHCYTYLKSCYITREAALGALNEETKTGVSDLIEYQNSINKEIAGYLVQLKNADTTNESKCYGFLPEDNKEYLEAYNDKDFFNTIKSTYVSIVSDAYCDVVYDDYFTNELHCYHIPQVNLGKNLADEVNAKMYKELNAILEKEVYSNMDDVNYFPTLSEMEYSWGQRDGIISIIVETNQTDWAWTEYYVYNISSETGKEILIEELLAKYNLSMTEFYSLSNDTIKKYWDGRSDLISMIGQDQYDILVERTLEEENVKSSIPYINSNGELCIVANIYSPAGADSYLQLLNTVSGAAENYLECLIEHSNETDTGTDITETPVIDESEITPEIKNESVTKQELIGEWEIDTDYTMDYSNMSMWDFYGSSFSDGGNKMIFNSDGSFSYYVAWCYGNGTFDVQDGSIILNLSDGDPSSIELTVTSDGEIRIGLDQYLDGKLVFWTKK